MREWDDKICSINVEPALGSPKIKIGSLFLLPPSKFNLLEFLLKNSIVLSIESEFT